MPSGGIKPIHPGLDDAASGVDAAVASAAARSRALESGLGAGGMIGELLPLPDVPAAHSKHAGGDDAGYAA